MPGRGRPPSGTRQRERDQRALDAEIVAVEPDAELRGPDLPEGDWPARTLKWWATWRKSPQAQTFTDTDWDFLLDTAMIHAAFVSGAVALAGELRLRVGKFGATPEDRMRLRLSIGKPAASGGPGVAPAAPRPAESPDRRERLLKAVQ